LRLFSFVGYGLALAALALVVFGAYDSYPFSFTPKTGIALMLENSPRRGFAFTMHSKKVEFGRKENSAFQIPPRKCDD